MEKKGQNQNGTEWNVKENYAIGYARRLEKRKEKKKKELPNIMKYNALVLVWFGLIEFGYVFIVSCGMGFVSV